MVDILCGGAEVGPFYLGIAMLFAGFGVKALWDGRTAFVLATVLAVTGLLVVTEAKAEAYLEPGSEAYCGVVRASYPCWWILLFTSCDCVAPPPPPTPGYSAPPPDDWF